jgi:hypothetical protein
MLKKQPTVTTAVAFALGPKYLGAYLPEFGMEIRVSFEHLPAGLTVQYNRNNDEVVISSGYGREDRVSNKVSGSGVCFVLASSPPKNGREVRVADKG